MSDYVIQRLRTGPDGTFGNFLINGGMVCVTCEPPWDDNQPDVSCIPTGTYTFQGFVSPVHGRTWKAIDVPNRSNIEIHSGNTVKDTEGCILMGENFGEIDGVPAVLNSKLCLMQLRALLPPEFTIQFEWVN